MLSKCVAIFYFLSAVVPSASLFSTFADNSQPFVDIPGDILLGGLAAIHDAGGVNNVKCESNISVYGMQRVEAMRYAVHKINTEMSFFRDNFTLGIKIRDSCGSETQALDESLQFVIDRVPVCKESNTSSALFGVVGASMSLLTAQVANLLRLFHIPLISYAATSVELSDTTKYDYLLRTVPPDSLQSVAMIDLIAKKLKWESVYVIYSAGSYGEHGYESFQEALSRGDRKKYDICIVKAVKLVAGMSVENIIKIFQGFYESEPGIRGIISYCEIPDVNKIVQAIDELNLSYHFRIIGSDNWITSPKTNESIIFSLHYNKTKLKGFYDWYSGLNPKNVNDRQNPWFRKFWNSSCYKVQQKYPSVDLHCENIEKTKFSFCKNSDPNTIEETCRDDDKLSYTIDAVYAYAHAIKDYYYSLAYVSRKGFLTGVTGKDFLDVLKKVKFKGVNDEVFFTEDDKAIRGNYDINQFNESGVLGRIGEWRSGKLKLYESWGNWSRFNFTGSSCKDECRNNEIREYTAKSCCWRCKECKRNEYIERNTTENGTKVTEKCTPCLPGRKPNANFTGCDELPIKHIDTLWETVIIIFVAIGVAFTTFTMVTFVRYLHTPLVKASGRELSFILLSGILMIYLIAFSLIFQPNKYTCGVARFGIGISLCLCYAALLTKTNRIARIFSGRQALSFLTPQWQVTLTMFLLIPQILIGVIGLVRDAPKASIIKEFSDYQIVKCNLETQDVIGSISYILILVLLCTYYAFKTRKVPANFNEARFIGFVMYTSCVIWVAFIPVVVGTSAEYRTVFIMLDLVINATTLLIGLFGIKLYIILLRPDKNCRTNSKARSVTFFSEGSLGNYSFDGVKDDSYEKFSTRSSPVVAYDNNGNEKSSVAMMMNGNQVNRTPKTSDASIKNGVYGKPNFKNGHASKGKMNKTNSLDKSSDRERRDSENEGREKRKKTLTF